MLPAACRSLAGVVRSSALPFVRQSPCQAVGALRAFGSTPPSSPMRGGNGPQWEPYTYVGADGKKRARFYQPPDNAVEFLVVGFAFTTGVGCFIAYIPFAP
uniref:Uncharacterized protein n=1 Tax=Chromera velia CCMP2878 TaxID=1169474 RepID=A0A0G4H9A0_9ALVE|mmetsp:Transcript_37039/g.72851  ORF Transcript_37039/g.72851 Transcript_37039/m.72851 type:complete len:101 (+) Transcript_37039:119-421(+)|eukprot:Cvel_5957.t1-p1 / transcript=Cvel_5957.t1 / gene=Cvel_5957 / organism=Chromera_velia_CCMP2878 / gene_product=hypothetical protein / transcript_product=hypothetical protein / location=Cvel_scaffold285:27987-28286(-) / protein_length=100 / sequence_SO=supercontig / SO=protein_coding / is_pseudo=false